MEEEVVESTEEVAEEVVEEEIQEEIPAEETVEEVVEEVVEQKPKQTAQERINEVTRKRREAERDAEYWKAKALEGKQPEPEKVATPAHPTRPTIDQFETAEQYEDALLDWHDGRKEAKKTADKAKSDNDKLMGEFDKRAKELRKTHADFDEALEAEVFSPEMKLALLKSEKGPEIAYYLAQPENWDTAEKIRDLSGDMQLYEMGKLETTLSIAKKTKKITTAPEPIKPVGISGKGEIDPSKLPIDEWMKWNEANEKAKIKVRLEGA